LPFEKIFKLSLILELESTVDTGILFL